MNSINLVGRATADPKVYTYDGGTVTKFTVAINRIEKKDEADFIRITTFGKLAENCYKYIYTGMRLSVSGRLNTFSYVNDDDETIYGYDVIAREVQFLEWKDDKEDEKKSSKNKNKK